ncbi:hypothetical protein PUNSTDRAFT_29952, partial [Punctularia strigosozonata HHB-11173 SS5]
ADVILRTSDNVDFRVYKLILSLASPFFSDMFTLPQAMDANVGQPVPPVINMAEDSATIDCLL